MHIKFNKQNEVQFYLYVIVLVLRGKTLFIMAIILLSNKIRRIKTIILIYKLEFKATGIIYKTKIHFLYYYLKYKDYLQLFGLL